MSAQLAERTYRPRVGERVNLRTYMDYSAFGLNPWTHLTVSAAYDPHDSGMVEVQTDLDLHSGAQVTVSIPVSMVETPIGWKPRYTIRVDADRLEQVLGWFQDGRGIAVLQSHYMPSCPTSFMPMDRAIDYEASPLKGTGDWRFNGADVDLVDAAQCDAVFQVVKVETGEPCISVECEYCHGTGKYRYEAPLTSPREWVTCNCTDGKRAVGLSSVTPAARKAQIAKLERDGWKIWYQRSGRTWRMERETVVKGFGETVPPVGPNSEVTA